MVQCLGNKCKIIWMFTNKKYNFVTIWFQSNSYANVTIWVQSNSYANVTIWVQCNSYTISTLTSATFYNDKESFEEANNFRISE